MKRWGESLPQDLKRMKMIEEMGVRKDGNEGEVVEELVRRMKSLMIERERVGEGENTVEGRK